MQSCFGFLGIYFFFSVAQRCRLACMRMSRKTNLRYNKDFRLSKNNFCGHDISQGLDREPPSLSPHFLLLQAIHAVVTSNDGFVKPATGFGKSICYMVVPLICLRFSSIRVRC